MSISRMSQLGGLALVSGLAMAGFAAQPAAAASVTFEFGSLADNASDSQVQNLMNTALGSDGSVVVAGAVGSNSYDADGHVTGPKIDRSYTSYTLADLDPAGNGTFIQNGSGSNDILMTFGGLTISNVSFDFEIFPDDSCTSLSSHNCGGHGNPNQPDLTFLANGTPIITWDGLAPGSGDSSNGVSASTYTHSPASGRDDEEAPQLLGWSGLIADLPANTTTLDFQDWPATIAINDLVINYSKDPPPVPEPASTTLLGSALVAFALLARRRRSAPFA